MATATVLEFNRSKGSAGSVDRRRSTAIVAARAGPQESKTLPPTPPVARRHTQSRRSTTHGCDHRVRKSATAERSEVEIREEIQANPVADEVAALVAVTRPILNGVLVSIGAEYLDAWAGDRTQVPLKLLGRLRKEGDGDTGIAFEYAVHDAVRGKNAVVMERVTAALELCRIKQGDPSSILFAIEKQGSKQLIETDLALITDDSRVLSGKQGQPVKLKKQMNTIAAAFRRANTRPNLPQSIRGLWKADLFLGSQTPDHWVGTSVKINPSHMEAAGRATRRHRSHAVGQDRPRTDRRREEPHHLSDPP